MRILVIDNDRDDAQAAVLVLEQQVGPTVAGPDADQAPARLEEKPL